MKKFIKLFTLALFSSISFYAQKELTISEAIQTTLENNLDIKISKNIETNIAITVSHENYENVVNLYNSLKNKYNIHSITAILAREEGVYKLKENKNEVAEAYKQLTDLIKLDLNNKKLAG